MSVASIIPMPHSIMLLAGCLFLLCGRLTDRTWIWGPACLLALTASAACLVVGLPTQSASLAPDALAMTFSWMSVALGLLFSAAAWETLRDSRNAAIHYGLLLLSLSGLMLVSAADDLSLLFVSLELVTLPLAALLLLTWPIGCSDTSRSQAEVYRSGRARLLPSRNPWDASGSAGASPSQEQQLVADHNIPRPIRSDTSRLEAGIKFLLLSALSSGVLLFGFALLFGLAGSSNLAEIRSVLSSSYTPTPPNVPVGTGSHLGIVALVLIVAGLGFKLFLVPFHFGLPEIHEGTSAWCAGLLATLPPAAAVIVIVRTLIGSMAGFAATGELTLSILAVMTMTVGNLSALSACNVRRILASVTAAHVGYVVLGLAVGFHDAANLGRALPSTSSIPNGVQAAVFYLVLFLPMTAGVFSLLVYLRRPERPLDFVEDLHGLVRSDPIAGVSAGILLLGLAGFPLFPGFWSRFLLLSAVLSSAFQSQHMVMLAVIAVVNMLLTAAVYLRLLSAIFLEAPIGQPRPTGGQPALSAGLLAALLSLGAGLMPGPLVGYVQTIRLPSQQSALSESTSVAGSDRAGETAHQRQRKRTTGNSKPQTEIAD